MSSRPGRALMLLFLAAGSAGRARAAGPTAESVPGPEIRREVVAALCGKLREEYIDPALAETLCRGLEKAEAAASPDLTAKQFGKLLSERLTTLSGDQHLDAGFHPDPYPGESGMPPVDASAMRAAWARDNYGFAAVEILPGNVGYLRVDSFYEIAEAAPVAIAALQFLARADALILDLRSRGGGAAEIGQLLLSYFLPVDTEINGFAWRENGRERLEPHRTHWVPGGPNTERPLFVLVSNQTISASEGLAYDVQARHRGTIVGERTAGAAQPSKFERLPHGFAALISNGRALNPVTGSNWEKTGVTPDVIVSAADALGTAHRLALENLLGTTPDGPRRAELRAILDARAKPPESAAGAPDQP